MNRRSWIFLGKSKEEQEHGSSKVLFLLFFLYSLSYILLLNAILRLSAGLAVLSHVWEISLARQNLCPNCLSAKTEAAGQKGPFSLLHHTARIEGIIHTVNVLRRSCHHRT